MKRQLGWAVASIVSLGTIGNVMAADLAARPYVKAPPMVAEPIYNWTGFYVGAFGGYGWGNHDRINDTGFANSYSSTGGVVGGTAGYNWQIQRFVLGVEGDLAWADIKGNDNFVGGSNDETTLRWYGTIRGRAGFAINKWLLFATAGYAFGDQRHVSTAATIDSFTSGTSGWTAGAGAEYAITANWIVKAEYRYLSFDRYFRAGTPNGLTPYNVASQYQTVTVGVNYKFGGPVVAKY